MEKGKLEWRIQKVLALILAAEILGINPKTLALCMQRPRIERNKNNT